MSALPWVRRSPPPDPASVDAALRSEPRLAAVERCGLLDSPVEESFDSVTRLAARLLGVPACFLTVVDADRDFYKSQHGFPEPLSEVRQLGGRTFCHYTLQSADALVINDTHSDPVWKAVPTVESLGVRAYVGVPLQIDGQNIGSFCVIDMKPRDWQPDELETIRQLAVSAGRELSLRSALGAARIEADNSRLLARSREEVVAVVAHDLRTPLQIMHLTTTLVKRSSAGEHDASADRMFKAIDAMKSMADGLLSSSAQMAPSLVGRKAVDIAELASDAVSMMGPIAERSGMTLTLESVPSVPVTIDYAQLLRVMGNLIGNAIKYSPQGSAVTVSGSREGSFVSITIKDNGKGMSEAEQDRAFDKGWQGAAGMVRGDGAGLGLSIAKTLLEEHSGTISMTSVEGEGTEMTISLPATDAAVRPI